MPLDAFLIGAILTGLLLAVASLTSLRLSGAQPGMARRLAGPAEIGVGRLLDADALPTRAVRVSGRIRCRDPLHMDGGERAVAFHRDVDVRLPRIGWRSLERLRETRSFELWDHEGSLTVDPAHAAEPLITIPKVWRGAPSELSEPHASGAARLAERHGTAIEARAVTRVVNVTDRLLVLARPARDPGGGTRLAPPDGGYLISNLPLPDAMRLLGGRHRRLGAASVIGLGLGAALIALGLGGALVSGLMA